MRRNIENLRKEVESTLRTCLALKQFRHSLRCKECTEKINENVYFWIIFQTSLQTNMFIGLRRLFDNGQDTFNFQKMIGLCKKNVGEFSKESLRQRKVHGSDNAEEWIESYMEDIY